MTNHHCRFLWVAWGNYDKHTPIIFQLVMVYQNFYFYANILLFQISCTNHRWNLWNNILEILMWVVIYWRIQNYLKSKVSGNVGHGWQQKVNYATFILGASHQIQDEEIFGNGQSVNYQDRNKSNPKFMRSTKPAPSLVEAIIYRWPKHPSST